MFETDKGGADLATVDSIRSLFGAGRIKYGVVGGMMRIDEQSLGHAPWSPRHEKFAAWQVRSLNDENLQITLYTHKPMDSSTCGVTATHMLFGGRQNPIQSRRYFRNIAGLS